MSTLPPGPRNLFINTVRNAVDTYGTAFSYFRRYGDPVTVPTHHGPLVLTGDPAGLREIYSVEPEVLEIAQTRDVLGLLLGNSSLILLTGSRHRRERKLLMPPFHGARMRAYGALFQEIALEFAGTWKRDQPFIIQETTQAISLEVIIRAVFGIQHPERVKQFHEVLSRLAGALSPLVLFFPSLRREFGGIGPWSRFVRLRSELDGLIYAEITGRRRTAEDREDILSLLLSARDDAGEPMTDEALRDELVTLLFAGHETTAITMAWAFYWIHRQPEVLERLRQELAPLGTSPTADALTRLPYLEAVCNEALRIYPVLPLVIRRTLQPFTLRGYALPAGTQVGVSTMAAHAHPQTYPDAERFRPERFLERSFSPFEFAPFGGGTRRCVGAAFAVYEMKVILGTVLARHRLELANGRQVKPRRRSITIGPGGGVEMVYRGAY